MNSMQTPTYIPLQHSFVRVDRTVLVTPAVLLDLTTDGTPVGIEVLDVCDMPRAALGAYLTPAHLDQVASRWPTN